MTARTLTLIRHAKSSWNNPALSDIERPLNKRGINDVPRVADELERAGVVFDRVLCSDARRARQTLSLLQLKLSISPGMIEYRHDLYGARAGDILTHIADQPNDYFNIAVVAHNPGLEDLANSIAETKVGSMSTCCVVHLSYDCKNWKKILKTRGKLELLVRPRDLSR